VSYSGGFLREQMRGFHDLQRQKPTSVHIVGMELKFNGLPNDAILVLGLSGEDGVIAVSQVSAVFSHGWLVWMFSTVAPVMLLQPCVHRTPCLASVDLAALTAFCIHPVSLVPGYLRLAGGN
jgi:hypothetical protein